MGIPWEWEHKYAKHGNGNGKSVHDNGNGNGYFFMCAKIPMGRLDANRVCISGYPLSGYPNLSVHFMAAKNPDILK